MASSVFSYLQNLWPFSILKTNDLQVSSRLIHNLSVPQSTKQFVFAVREPDSLAVVYVLAVQNLSEESARDAQYLIKEVKPEAVVVQVAPSAYNEIQAEEKSTRDNEGNNVPTSSFGVLRRCLVNKVNKEYYDNLARCQVLREIFGVGFYGHFFAAKRAAEEVDSHFLLLESPYENACTAQQPSGTGNEDQNSGLNMHASCLLPGKVASVVCSNSRRFCLTDTVQSQMVESLMPLLDLLVFKEHLSPSVSEPESRSDYQAPSFAQSVYPLLEDLHTIFHSLPAVGKALVSAQKMLNDVSEGEPVDSQLLSEVHNFRIAVEGLRIAVNNASRCPIDEVESRKLSKMGFSELPSEEKCHALFAEAIRSQAKKYGSVVAIVDAGNLAGLRRHWRTSVPPEVSELANQCFTHYFGEDLDDDEKSMIDSSGRKRLLADKPVVAVGAGATAVLGASSLSKTVQASTLFKLAPFKFPSYVHFSIAQLQRATAISLSKILGPSKLVAPKVASIGTKTSIVKLAASAEKIRAVTHSMIASAQRTSLLAIRTSFYEIMRRRGVKSARLVPWVTFSCSVAACSGLLTYGDGIECVAESIPSVPTIASMGRGLQSLHQASMEVQHASSKRIQESLKSLMCSLKKK